MNLIPDIPRIYTALAEWCACVVCLMNRKRRVKGWKFGILALAVLVIQTFFLEITKSLPIIFWIPCMVAALAIMFGFICFCAEINVREAAYCCIRAFVSAELAASLEWQIHCFFLKGKINWNIYSILILVLVYMAVFAILFLLERRYRNGNLQLMITWQELCSEALIGFAVFAISNLSFVSANTPFSGQYGVEILSIRTVVDLGGVAVLYAYHVQCYELRVRRELEAIQRVLQNQYVQYQQSKESIELINQKYHDLKHQITLIRAENDTKKRNDFLDKMEEEIKNYESQNKTGNPVLDTVLTGKSFYCARQGITLTCVADGVLLNFMDAMDICSIFGNALDNAIECVEKLEDEEKRLIHVSVSAQKKFVLLRFENYCDDELRFHGDLPETTKGDLRYHGYGLKSIQNTSQKYGGTVTVQVEKKWFELKVLLPMPEA